jgi:GNAT superfamily N-acetyltransferase
MGALALVRVSQLDHAALEPLLEAAAAEGHRFLQRLVDEWRSGANRFDRGAAEACWSVREGTAWVAVGGLNVDPRAGDQRSGRVRHFYVLADFRRRGCGRRLLEQVISHAQPHFDQLLLRTDHAAAFCERCGFSRFEDARTQSTHRLKLD